MGRLSLLALAALLTFSGCSSLVMLSTSPDPWVGHFIVGVSPSEGGGLSASRMAPYRTVLVAGFSGKEGDEVAKFIREGLREKGYLVLGPFPSEGPGLVSAEPGAFQEAEPGVPALLSASTVDAVIVGKSLEAGIDPLEARLSLELIDAKKGEVVWSSSGQYTSGRLLGHYDYLEAMRFLVKKALQSLPAALKGALPGKGPANESGSEAPESSEAP